MPSGSDASNITEDVRTYATEQPVSTEEERRRGRDEKSKPFAAKGAEVYAKAWAS